jgi:class 3 adenylate cyclase
VEEAWPTGQRKNFDEPDEAFDFELVSWGIVRLGDMTVGRTVDEPGWRWTTHMRPFVGTAFDGAARAVQCGIEIVAAARSLELEVRAGVHTGEVEVVGSDVRGIAVHEAARIAAAAAPGQVLVSAVTRTLATGSDLTFDAGSDHELKGIDGTRRLYPAALLASRA